MTASSFISYDPAIDSPADFGETFNNALQHQHLFNRKAFGGKIKDLEHIQLTEKNIDRIYFCWSPCDCYNSSSTYEILGRMKYDGKPLFIHLIANIYKNCEEGDEMDVEGLMIFSWDGLSFMNERLGSKFQLGYFLKEEVKKTLLAEGMRYSVPILQNICLEFVFRNKHLYPDQLRSLPKTLVEKLEDIKKYAI